MYVQWRWKGALSYSSFLFSHNKTRLRFDVREFFEARKSAAIRFVHAPPRSTVRQYRAFNHLESINMPQYATIDTRIGNNVTIAIVA